MQSATESQWQKAFIYKYFHRSIKNAPEVTLLAITNRYLRSDMHFYRHQTIHASFYLQACSFALAGADNLSEATSSFEANCKSSQLLILVLR
jgi:hypothetical protein